MRLVYGVGINDAGYITQKFENSGAGRKLVWICPYYQVWRDMLKRCYSPSYQAMRPSYSGVQICQEWLKFSEFKRWMEGMDWHGRQLDKDLLSVNGKIYSPESCCFVSKRVNSFMTDRAADRGDWPIGVHFDKGKKKFVAAISDIGKKSLGTFETPEDAHEAWLSAKRLMAIQLSFSEPDPRVRSALSCRYVK